MDLTLSTLPNPLTLAQSHTGPAPPVYPFADSPLPRTIQDSDGRLMAVNPAFARLVGSAAQSLVGRDPESLPCIVALDRPFYDQRHAVQPGAGAAAPATCTIYGVAQPDGSRIYFERIDEPLPGARTSGCTSSIWHEITTRVSTEALQNDRFEHVLKLFDMIPIGLLASDGNGQPWRANSTMRAMVGDALDRVTARVPTTPQPGDPAGDTSRRHSLTLADGTTRWIDWYAASVPAAAGLPALEVAAAIDVTREVELEADRAARSADQVRVQLREVHHRIKNNLQGIAGLIQHNCLRLPQAAPILEGLSEQIYAVAEVYGLQADDSGLLSLSAAVRAIARNLSTVHGKAIDVCDSSDPELNGWAISQSEAVRCALVLNELMTNAIKHGVGAEPCSVALNANADGCEVRIRNAGEMAPAPAEPPGQSSLSGLGLMRAMLPDRGRELSFRSRDGAVTAVLQLRPPMVKRR